MMRKSTIIKIIIASVFLYGLIGFLKSKYISPSLNENFLILWIIDLATFGISFALPLLIGINYDKINELKIEINNIKENIDVNKYDTFKFLYGSLKKKSNNFQKYLSSLSDEYLFVRFYKPIMDFFYLDNAGSFYSDPKKINPIILEIFKVLDELEFKIKEENLAGGSICPREDRIEIVEKVLSISCFYNFYYPINADKNITQLINAYDNKFVFKDSSLRLSLAVESNNFKFNNDLINHSLLDDDSKNDLFVFFQIQSDSVKLAQVVNFIAHDYNIFEIVNFYIDFFEIGKRIDPDNSLISLIYNTELLAFLDYSKTSFSKVNISEKQKEELYSQLNIKTSQLFEKINNLGDFILKYFNLKYGVALKDYLNEVFSQNISREIDSSYHPLFNLYFSLNSRVSTGINYSPRFKGIDNEFFELKKEYIKDIHVWYINKMNGLIRNNQIEQAKELYDELDFDKIHSLASNNCVYKYSMLICKSVFLNRLEDSYKESIDLLNIVLQNTSLNSDIRDVKDLIFVFAFEKQDKPNYRRIYDSANKNDKANLIITAHWIRMFEKIKYLHIGNWLYVSYPVRNGYLRKDNINPRIINGINA